MVLSPLSSFQQRTLSRGLSVKSFDLRGKAFLLDWLFGPSCTFNISEPEPIEIYTLVMPVSIPSHLPSSPFLSSFTVAFLQKLTVFQISAEKCRSTGSQSAKLHLNPHALCVLPSFLHWPSFDDPNHRQLPLSRGFVSGRTHEPWRLQSWAQNEKIVHPVISSTNAGTML